MHTYLSKKCNACFLFLTVHSKCEFLTWIINFSILFRLWKNVGLLDSVINKMNTKAKVEKKQSYIMLEGLRSHLMRSNETVKIVILTLRVLLAWTETNLSWVDLTVRLLKQPTFLQKIFDLCLCYQFVKDKEYNF